MLHDGEAELFGHVRGSFTGAAADQPGKFEVAEPRGKRPTIGGRVLLRGKTRFVWARHGLGTGCPDPQLGFGLALFVNP
jgi:hypothetical protein